VAINRGAPSAFTGLGLRLWPGSMPHNARNK